MLVFEENEYLGRNHSEQSGQAINSTHTWWRAAETLWWKAAVSPLWEPSTRLHDKAILLHILCGYQCDKAMNNNDTREVIYHFTEWSDISLHGFELYNQIDCKNLVAPIGLHVLF